MLFRIRIPREMIFVKKNMMIIFVFEIKFLLRVLAPVFNVFLHITVHKFTRMLCDCIL